MKLLAILAGAAALALAGTASSANLVLNGDFESSSVAGAHEFGASYVHGQSVASWNSAAANAFNLWFPDADAANGPTNADTRFTASEGGQYLYQAFTSPTGGAFVALDGDTEYNGALTQTISGLMIGQQYKLKFDWATGQYANRVGETTEFLRVGFGGQTFDTATVAIPTAGFGPWTEVQHVFTATSTNQVLSFLSIGTPNGLPPVALLDGVSLTAVPEPATWAMMIGGFGLLGAVVRRRRVAAVA